MYSYEGNKLGGGTRAHKVHKLGWDTQAPRGVDRLVARLVAIPSAIMGSHMVNMTWLTCRGLRAMVSMLGLTVCLALF